MLLQNLPLTSYTNGVIMIAIFGLVSVALVVVALLFVLKGSPKKK